MSYNDVRTMAKDIYLVERIAACVAGQGQPLNMGPLDWAWTNNWTICASSGWDASWESGTAAGIQNLGANEGVITDAMILTAVQTQLGMI